MDHPVSRTLGRIAWLFLPIALHAAGTAAAPVPSRWAEASDVELVTAFERQEDGLARCEIAREMARRDPEGFAPLFRTRLTADHFTDRIAAGLVLARAGDDAGLELVLAEMAAGAAQVEWLRTGGPKSKAERFLPWQEGHHQQYLASMVLGEIGDSRAVEPLIEATRDAAFAYRAALSLGEIGDRRAIPALREMALRFPDDRHWAGMALARMGEPDGFELLIDVAASDLGWDQRRHAIVALGELGHRGAVETLAAMLAPGRVNVHLREAAVRALGEIGDPAALPALRAALGDDERTNTIAGTTIAELATEAIRRIESGPGA